MPGAVCDHRSLRAGFGTKLAWIADRDQEIVLIGRDDEDAPRGRAAGRRRRPAQARRLPARRDDGLARASGRPVEAVERLDVPGCTSAASATSYRSSTCASESEWGEGHIPGSVHIPYHDIHGVPDELDAGRPVAVICGSGQRSVGGREPAAAPRAQAT